MCSWPWSSNIYSLLVATGPLSQNPHHSLGLFSWNKLVTLVTVLRTLTLHQALLCPAVTGRCRAERMWETRRCKHTMTGFWHSGSLGDWVHPVLVCPLPRLLYCLISPLCWKPIETSFCHNEKLLIEFALKMLINSTKNRKQNLQAVTFTIKSIQEYKIWTEDIAQQLKALTFHAGPEFSSQSPCQVAHNCP